ncbi:PP2C family serine/threonine-protein phosphatase [Salinibacterium sp. ZJ450]|uniref:PP2C family protein-serine/threonine phosphatase n=1 Tax=Salinibacterium sp. ZJ450 TaxID=2708338 RepID=UPI001CD6534D|nr:protein phosphatase 2C domain-containing protein [Salinibacterium sp. ZJ450]
MTDVAAPPTRTGSVELRFGVRSDVGLRRAVNEDAVLAESPVFLVADGMGGHEAGDRASLAVVEAFRPLGGRLEITAAEVVQAVESAHATVRRLAATLERGAGSTLTAVVLLQSNGVPHWLVVNIGDSRVYRMTGTDLQ